MARLKFSAWRDAADQFKAAGLTVALLIADGRDTAHQTDPATAFAWLKQHRIPFPAGMLTDEAFGRLTTAHRQLFGAIVNLPIPTSFRLDRKGRLTAIYRGSVSTERILFDVALADDKRAAAENKSPVSVSQPVASRRSSRLCGGGHLGF